MFMKVLYITGYALARQPPSRVEVKVMAIFEIFPYLKAFFVADPWESKKPQETLPCLSLSMTAIG
jgi:hypothetical protein